MYFYTTQGGFIFDFSFCSAVLVQIPLGLVALIMMRNHLSIPDVIALSHMLSPGQPAIVASLSIVGMHNAERSLSA